MCGLWTREYCHLPEACVSTFYPLATLLYCRIPPISDLHGVDEYHPNRYFYKVFNAYQIVVQVLWRVRERQSLLAQLPYLPECHCAETCLLAMQCLTEDYDGIAAMMPAVVAKWVVISQSSKILFLAKEPSCGQIDPCGKIDSKTMSKYRAKPHPFFPLLFVLKGLFTLIAVDSYLSTKTLLPRLALLLLDKMSKRGSL